MKTKVVFFLIIILSVLFINCRLTVDDKTINQIIQNIQSTKEIEVRSFNWLEGQYSSYEVLGTITNEKSVKEVIDILSTMHITKEPIFVPGYRKAMILKDETGNKIIEVTVDPFSLKDLDLKDKNLVIDVDKQESLINIIDNQLNLG